MNSVQHKRKCNGTVNQNYIILVVRLFQPFDVNLY